MPCGGHRRAQPAHAPWSAAHAPHFRSRSGPAATPSMQLRRLQKHGQVGDAVGPPMQPGVNVDDGGAQLAQPARGGAVGRPTEFPRIPVSACGAPMRSPATPASASNPSGRPTSTCSIRTQVCTSVAIGPTVSWLGASGVAPADRCSRCRRKPTTRTARRVSAASRLGVHAEPGGADTGRHASGRPARRCRHEPVRVSGMSDLGVVPPGRLVRGRLADAAGARGGQPLQAGAEVSGVRHRPPGVPLRTGRPATSMTSLTATSRPADGPAGAEEAGAGSTATSQPTRDASSSRRGSVSGQAGRGSRGTPSIPPLPGSARSRASSSARATAGGSFATRRAARPDHEHASSTRRPARSCPSGCGAAAWPGRRASAPCTARGGCGSG